MRDKRKKDIVTDKTVRNERIKTGVTGAYAVYAVFAVIGIVYCLSLLVLYPNLPITTRQADSIQGYDRYYPPFRTDEYNYYDIANNILNGNLYEDGSFERSYPLGFSLVTVPFVAVLDKMGGYAANVVIVLLSLILFYRVIQRFNSTTHALALVTVLAFATLNWFYAVSCYSEPLAQLLVVLTVYCMFSGKDSTKKTLFFIAAGCATGLNLFVRPHYIVIAVPFFISLWLHGKSRFSLKNHGILYAAGVSAIILVWFIRNTMVFGGPLTFEYTRMVGQFVTRGIEGGVKGNVFTGTHRLLFDEFHGLLTITPVLLVFPAGLNRMWQHGLRNEAVTFLVSVIVMIVIFASGPYPFTEFGLGSRHMMPMYPLMLIPAVFFIDEKFFSRAVIFVLALYSFYHAGIGWFTGTYPGMGYLPGFLNDTHARAAILARKGELPKRNFKNADELFETHIQALNDFNMYTFLQTLDPEVLTAINGKERDFLLYWRFRQDEIKSKVRAIDPERGISYEGFKFVTPQGSPVAQPEVQQPE